MIQSPACPVCQPHSPGTPAGVSAAEHSPGYEVLATSHKFERTNVYQRTNAHQGDVIPKLSPAPVISDGEVRSLINMHAAMDAVEQAYILYGHERRVLSDPPALLLSASSPAQTAFKVKGARLTSLGVAGFRIIADKVTNDEEQTIDYCWVADEATGRLIGLVEETWLHRLRTAVTGVTAAKWLARRESRVAAIIGAGKIADEIPAPLCSAFEIQEIRTVARHPKSAQAFADRHASITNVRPYPNVSEALVGADIVFCISSSSTPIVQAADVAPGVFLCGMGGGPEIAADVLDHADRFIVDDLEYALSIGSVRGWVEKGVHPEDISQRVSASMADLAIGAKQGRVRDTDVVVAIVQGMAICDLALAHLVLSRAGLISAP